jgi:transcriptional regulator with XRE-family HTH domain
METPPAPQPEGLLLESARQAARLTAREAARRAGISEGYWRQVVKGYQSVSGGAYAPISDVPAKTIARMAVAVGLSPERMETEGGRPDAADRMRSTPAPAAQPPAGATLTVADPAGERMAGELARLEVEVWTEMSRHPTGTRPAAIFAHPAEVALMGVESAELPQRVRWIAEFRYARAHPPRADSEPERRAG